MRAEYEALLKEYQRITLDAVVQCKECMHATMTSDGLIKCRDVWDLGDGIYMNGNSFCSFGKKKEE